MSLTPGTMVTQNVRLLEVVGQGGMGSVWLADHLGLETQVAVKFITPELVAQVPSLKQRFHREASITAKLRSIHAVQTFDHGVMEDGTPYIVMELLEGKDLAARIDEDGPLTLREVGMLVAQVAKVLHRAHKLGIVHRDMKPDNVFLTEDSDYELFVKVLDFGIAKESDKQASSNMTKTGAVVGTPEFMSPEQAISAKELDHRSDLFSLGVVAFYALTGELPYDEESETPLWLQMSQGQHRSVRSLLPHLGPAVEAWFDRCLQPKPDQRFASAREMAKALAEAVARGGHQAADELSSIDDGMNLPAAATDLDPNEDSWPDFAELPVPDGPPTQRRAVPAALPFPEIPEDRPTQRQVVPAVRAPLASSPPVPPPVPPPRAPMASHPPAGASMASHPPARAPMASHPPARAPMATHPPARAPMASHPPGASVPPPRAPMPSLVDEASNAASQWGDEAPTSTRTVRRQATAAAVFLVVLGAVAIALVSLGMV